MIVDAVYPLIAGRPLGATLLLAEREWVGLATGGAWLALILVLLAGALKMAKEYRRNGLRVLGIFNGNDADGAQDAHLDLTKFRELHARGGLSDEEYRIIKTKLASELQTDAAASIAPSDSPAANSKAKSSGVESLADAAGPVFEAPVFEAIDEATSNELADNELADNRAANDFADDQKSTG